MTQPGPRFDRSFDPRYGDAVRLTPLVRRVTVKNPGPMTFYGTNSYLIGDRDVAVIDPGPIDAAHLDALLYAIGLAKVVAILVTHTHADHSPAAHRLALKTGAPLYGAGTHRPATTTALGTIAQLDASGDTGFVPDHLLRDGDTVTGDGWTMTAVATPGHAANHLAFALEEEASLFSGDHVMAWSTSVIAPPDGAMADYRASLQRLLERPEEHYWPGHGGPVLAAKRFVQDLIEHRHGRETAIIARLKAGDDDIAAMVSSIYAAVDRRLHGAAALSVLAHLEDLVQRGIVTVEGPIALNSRYRLAP